MAHHHEVAELMAEHGNYETDLKRIREILEIADTRSMAKSHLNELAAILSRVKDR